MGLGSWCFRLTGPKLPRNSGARLPDVQFGKPSPLVRVHQAVLAFLHQEACGPCSHERGVPAGLRGNGLDDALHHVVVERDMLRLLLIERPKVAQATWQRPDPRLSAAPKKREGGAGCGLKRRRSGESWAWLDGRCKDRNCPCKHARTICSSPDHHSEQCDSKPDSKRRARVQ